MAYQYAELGASSAFSFLQATCEPETLVHRAAHLGVETLALTDYGGVYGIPRFHRAARTNGINAIVGARIDVLGVGQLRLLCESPRGYKNLCRLITLGRRERGKKQCIVTTADLKHFAEGLTCLAGPSLDSVQGRIVQRIRDIYSDNHFAIEINRHLDRAIQRKSQTLLELAEHLHAPAVATNDVHHTLRKHKALHDVMTCIRTHQSLAAAGRDLFPNAERHLKTAASMQTLFSDRPDLLGHSVDIAERCSFRFEHLDYRFPNYPTPLDTSEQALLQQLAFAGARKRYRKLTPRITQQLEKELRIIGKLNLAGYFLIVWDIVQFARSEGILVQGRGSAANSAVCYSLEITAVDPIGMDLLFERFLSEERGEWPDIDLDLPSGNKREQVIQYIYKKYGPHGAAMTANVITYRARSALRETGKALGFSAEQIGRAAQVAGRWSNPEDPKELAEQFSRAGLAPDEHRVTLWMKATRAMLGRPRHMGQHSGGMVIAAGRLDEVSPIEPASMPDRSIIQWDKDDCATIGIIKVDILGLGMLAALEEAVPLIRQTEGVEIDYAHLPQNDPDVFAALRRADTVGVFQIESRAQMATLPRLKPTCFYDLVIEIALIRPGPIVGQMVHPYLNRRSGKEKVVYAHPDLEPILKRTLGVPIFQEQILRIAMTVAGFTGGEAEELRRALGFKRSAERMDDISQRLRSGMQKKGIEGRVQDELIRCISSFALYGFPESHSASFALIAYASAYLKTHHPGAFLCALLNAWPMGFYHPATLIKDAQRHGVRIRPIDITTSQWKCTLIDKDTVLLGLRYVGGLQVKTAQRILEARQHKPFISLKDFRYRSKVNQTDFNNLAELGAFANLGHTRRSALWQSNKITTYQGELLRNIQERNDCPLPEMTLPERIEADYRHSSVSAGPHPMALIRPQLHEPKTQTTQALQHIPNGKRASVAGMAIARQRPINAKGIFFITLEDETGFANLIVPPKIFEQYKSILVSAPGLWADGIVQNHQNVVHLKVRHLCDLQEVTGPPIPNASQAPPTA